MTDARQLPTDRRRLLERWITDLDPQAPAGSGDDRARPATDDAAGLPAPSSAPLSSAQQRVWVLEQIVPGTSAYTMAYALDVHGHLDPGALRTALQRVLDRHEALRATFETDEDGSPRQRFREPPPREAVLDEVDLTGVAEDELDDRASAVATEHAGRRFDLVRGPLTRFTLVHLGPGRQMLLLAFHHLVFDGWSKSIVMADLTAVYDGVRDGTEPALAAVPYGYGTHAQREASRPRPPMDAYWTERFADPPPPLELPTDRPRPARQSFRGGREWFTLDPGTVARLREVAAAHEATVFATLLAAWAVFLHRWAGTTSTAIGTPSAGRRTGEQEQIVGFFVDTLALRVDVDPGARFRDVLATAMETTLGAFDADHVRFEQLVDEYGPDRSAARNPLFQTMVVLENTPPPPMEVDGATLHVRHEDHPSAQFDLMLFLFAEHEGELSGFLEYSADLFDVPTVRRMIDSLGAVLDAVLDDPARAVATVPRLGPASRAEVVELAHGPRRDDWADAGLDQLVVDAASAVPDRTAIVGPGGELTYAELLDGSAAYARELRAMGVVEGETVGVLLERSLPLLPALLGILRAGATFLPLDTAYPEARLRYLVEDSGVSVVVCSPDLAGLVAGDCRLLRTDRVAGTAAGGELPRPAPDPGRAAYLLYTSGSTGRPKGVLVSGRAVVNRLRWMQDEFDLGERDRVLQKTPLGFDVSMWELFWPLVTGATMVLAAPGEQRDPERLARTLCEQRVSVVHYVPSMLRLTCEGRLPGRCPDLRLVVCSGEALSPELVGRFEELREAFAPSAELVNLYGPTEAAVDVTLWRCSPADASAPAVPIGRPMAHCAVHVLDDDGEPLPPGVAGELHLGGVQVALGYHRRPELTAQRFVPDPFVPGGTLFRTGDLGRLDTDGIVHYLGRLDRQVKIRGVRVEPGELEHAAAELDGVARAVAVVRGDDGDRWLALFLVPDDGAAVDVAAARQALRAGLPPGLVPRSVDVVDDLPVTANGKLDTAALTERTDSRPADADESPGGAASAHGSASGEAPRGEVAPDARATEGAAPEDRAVREALAGAWRDVFGTDAPAPDTDFFDVGGDSIVCVRLVARARARGVEIEPADVFAYPTPAGLAEIARATGPPARAVPPADPAPAADLAPAADPAPVGDPGPWHADPSPLGRVRAARAAEIEDAYPLTPLQDHMLHELTMRPMPGLYLVQRRFHLTGTVDVEALTAAWEAVVARHGCLRTSFTEPLDGTGFQVVHRHGESTLRHEDLRAVDPAARAAREDAYVAEDQRCRWWPERPEAMRIRIFQRTDSDHLFVVSFNYMLVDGWSLGLIMQDLFTLYAAHREGRPASLPPRPPYRAVAERLGAGPRPEARRFWVDWLGGGLPDTPVADPDGGPRNASLTLRPFDRRHRYLDAACTQRLRDAARAWRVTPSTLVTVAWGVLVAHRCGTADAVLGVTSSGRAVPVEGVDDVVGPCINTLPQRVSVPPDTRIDSCVRAVQQTAQEARRFEYVSLREITEWLGRADGDPPFDHYLIFQNLGELMESGDLPGLRVVDDVPLFHTKMEHPLRIDVFPGAELGIFFSHHRDRLDDATAQELLDGLVATLTGLADSDPADTVADLRTRAGLSAGAGQEPGAVRQ